jgi:hypothetical protein
MWTTPRRHLPLPLDLGAEDTPMLSRLHDHEQPADAMTMLQADHQRLKDLFAPSEATRDRAMKRTLAEQICVAWDTHAPLEEPVFDPAGHAETDEGPALVKKSPSEDEMGHNLIPVLQSKRRTPMDIHIWTLAFFATLSTVVILVRCHPLASLLSTSHGPRQGVHPSTPGAEIPLALKEGQTIVSVEDTTTAMCFYIGTDVLEEKDYD